MAVIIIGHFGEFEFVGPFDTQEAAMDWAHANLNDATWWVAVMRAPE